jgi:hypothetical protein
LKHGARLFRIVPGVRRGDRRFELGYFLSTEFQVKDTRAYGILAREIPPTDLRTVLARYPSFVRRHLSLDFDLDARGQSPRVRQRLALPFIRVVTFLPFLSAATPTDIVATDLGGLPTGRLTGALGDGVALLAIGVDVI